jgi:regulator of PEP synthase PpsR (kinase-PPPase family)
MPLRIHLLSGGTGRTCDQVLTAALAQFESPRAELLRHGKLRDAREAGAIVRAAARERAVICHSLVEPEVRATVVETAEALEVPTVDVLGPVIALLEDVLGAAPLRQPGLSQELHKERFERMDAVDFTLAHDDGLRLHDLHAADVVLVGVSRVAKSVTCFYLAARGLRAANVPLISRTAPPEELLGIDPHKVIGLTMSLHQMVLVRQARARRARRLRAALEPYVDESEIKAELTYARRLMAKHGWRSIDVSYKAVEEVASEVVSLLPALYEARPGSLD